VRLPPVLLNLYDKGVKRRPWGAAMRGKN